MQHLLQLGIVLRVLDLRVRKPEFPSLLSLWGTAWPLTSSLAPSFSAWLGSFVKLRLGLKWFVSKIPFSSSMNHIELTKTQFMRRAYFTTQGRKRLGVWRVKLRRIRFVLLLTYGEINNNRLTQDNGHTSNTYYCPTQKWATLSAVCFLTLKGQRSRSYWQMMLQSQVQVI